ncbi:MAG: acyltransferase [Microbacterium sp.]|uniref:acyltransferase n=1 Tax=Microbacterium sp. TaxID=51671 RepID=UPI001AD16B39|nr:acyltransferase [Microbacterium sp.]MBN9178183.1 acyltransferase [Microbacterium sp.]
MSVDRFQHSPWSFWTEADAAAQVAQLEAQASLRAAHPEWRIGAHCFVSDLAAIDADVLDLGDRSYVAAGAYLTGTLRIGRDVSVNPYTVIRGDVVIGDATRIGAHTSILGFNHTMEPDVEVRLQPLTSRGIRIGDDVWIGSHVVVLDGVTVGSRAVLAAGAIVTKDVPAGAVIGGNPARVLKWRVPPVDPLRDAVATFADTARREASVVLERSWQPDAGRFADRPGAAPTLRAQCDAVEIADLLLAETPPQRDAASWRELIDTWPLDDGTDPSYRVLCAGYALDLLGASFSERPALLASADLVTALDALPWATDAWAAGHEVDAYGTALLWCRRAGAAAPAGYAETLFGWLVTHTDPVSGVWGEPAPDTGMLLPVNGFYRATRGTFAQFGVPVPHPERVIDTVLAHAGDERFFAPDRRNACNVLDVAHPLWLTRSTGHRTTEVVALGRDLLADALTRWVPLAGISFGPDDEPGLQGTEMWLAIVWYLADLAGLADALDYRPRGIHRPESVDSLA